MILDRFKTATAAAVRQAPILPATARGEATRRKLLDAAGEEFGSKGFHAASVSSITTTAGVGQGTFYLYFRTKEEIFTTLVREIGRELRRQLRAAASRALNPMDAERRSMEAVFDFTVQHPGLYRVVQESQFVDEAVYREYYEQIARGHTEDLDAAARRGEIAPGNSEARAWALIGVGHFLGLRHCLWAHQMPPPEAMDATMDLIARGVAPR